MSCTTAVSDKHAHRVLQEVAAAADVACPALITDPETPEKAPAPSSGSGSGWEVWAGSCALGGGVSVGHVLGACASPCGTLVLAR